MSIEVAPKCIPEGLVAEASARDIFGQLDTPEEHPLTLPHCVGNGKRQVITVVYYYKDDHRFHSSSTHVLEGLPDRQGGTCDDKPFPCGHIEETGEDDHAGYFIVGK